MFLGGKFMNTYIFTIAPQWYTQDFARQETKSVQFWRPNLASLW